MRILNELLKTEKERALRLEEQLEQSLRIRQQEAAPKEGFQVLYLSKKLKVGPRDGSSPAEIARPLRRQELLPIELPWDQERQLTAMVFRAANGDERVNIANKEEWMQMLRLLLVSKETASAITRGLSWCSDSCLDEDGDG